MFFPENSTQAVRDCLQPIEEYIRETFVPPVPAYEPDSAPSPGGGHHFLYYTEDEDIAYFADDEDVVENLDDLSPEETAPPQSSPLEDAEHPEDSGGTVCKPVLGFGFREEQNQNLLSVSMGSDWTGMLKKKLDGMTGETFVQKVDSLIAQRQLTYPAVYRAANLNRQLFSKMMSRPDYKPSKDTAVAVAFEIQP